MAASWEHADVFPVIAKIIDDSYASKGDFVTHDEITASLTADPEGIAIIQRAQQELNEKSTADWIAHNMVAWFSQRISVGESDWHDRFDRIKVDNKWAYKPKAQLMRS